MSKTIAINAGSSSLKFQLFQMPEETVLAKGLVERIGLKDSIFTVSYGDGEKHKLVLDIHNHDQAVQMLLDTLLELKIVEKYEEITGVGHRVVAGGEIFKDSALIDDKVIEQIESLTEYAPLHQPAEVAGIRAFKKLLPHITSVAVFDTSFHTSMPKKAYLYSLPIEYYEKYGARRYGAHGTSHNYVSRRAAAMLGKDIKDTKIITCHLGNGGSITAVDGGKSVDTSMGFTPLAGITMGTRAGDFDASLIPFLMEKEGMTSVNEFIDVANKKSGLLGLSTVSSDMRDVEAAAAEGNEHAKTTYEVFIYRIQKYIGAYIAAMNGVDAIVFTAGIGENSAEVRRDVIGGLTWFGCDIDPEANALRGQEKVVSTPNAKVKVLNIPTDEEVEIARDVERLKK
ncbi:acetate kinase [Carnobacteriaceae bacterium zg-ZUI78]|uniref:acetate/propionate family kinase n=1 Tax=Granulicatella sp. zg-84 TaxID=2678503 RepID=UPI0013C0C655|nr:acetate kinase [Granulicatella sp. zg-84]MBS4750460.1 acetate kinase [Carnobacteriaceae bacterium zg-ZUI78]NEW66742.1 acetate/propionate family kinase [Granulicatella sp. zg-84]QMI85414.1 acetate kinase [Carnobacteriaceae bacterium zg-84]